LGCFVAHISTAFDPIQLDDYKSQIILLTAIGLVLVTAFIRLDVGIQLLFFLSGLLINTFHIPVKSLAGPIQSYNQKIEVTVFGRQVGYATRTSFGQRIIVDLDHVILLDSIFPISDRISLAIKDASQSLEMKPGVRYRIEAFLQLPSGPNMPDGFSWSRYLLKQGIRIEGKTDASKIKIIEDSNWFSKNAFTVRSRISETLLQKINNPNQLGIAAALLLGNEDWLTYDIESSFSNAGVLHVLCVSGMHVVLFYSLLLVLMKPIMYWNNSIRSFLFILLVFTVWFYAYVTGLGPSVVRAASMATLSILGMWLEKRTHKINLICASLILLAILDPRIFLQIGFQLSFLAVLGIFFISPLVNKLIQPRNKILKMTWELITVTIGAQIATFPLSTNLFGQFPNFFLPANMIIVPMSTICMYLGIGLIVVSDIPKLDSMVRELFSISLDILLSCVRFFSEIPYAVTNNIHFSEISMISCYILILSLLIFTNKKSYANLMIMLICATMYLGSFVFVEVINKAKKMTYLSVFKKSLILTSINEESSDIIFMGKDSTGLQKVKNEIEIRQGVKVENIYYIEKFGLILFPTYKLAVVNKLDGINEKIAEITPDISRVETLSIFNKSEFNPEFVVTTFPSLKTIVYKNEYIQLPTLESRLKGSKQYHLKILTKEGFLWMKSDAIQTE
jgi:ComEC/Rec2-related protein